MGNKNSSKHSRPLNPSLRYDSYKGTICVEHIGINFTPRSIAVEDTTCHIYVTNGSAISVFTPDCVHITTFHCPCMVNMFAIALYSNGIYATDYTSLLLMREDMNVCNVYRKEEIYIFNLAISQEDEVYMADAGSSRVIVLCCNLLEYTREISCKSMVKPVDVKLTSSDLYVLSENGDPRMHVFSHRGTLRYSLDTRVKTMHKTILGTYNFCIDIHGNLLVIDFFMRAVVVYNKHGEYLHTLGNKFFDGHVLGISFVNEQSLVIACSNTLIVFSDH